MILPPTQELVMEVLAARYRLGEGVWPFSTRCRPAISALATDGLVGFKGGIVEHTVQVWLTEAGLDVVLGDGYVLPLARARAEALREAREAVAALPVALVVVEPNEFLNQNGMGTCEDPDRYPHGIVQVAALAAIDGLER
jgi:hypothetical protein